MCSGITNKNRLFPFFSTPEVQLPRRLLDSSPDLQSLCSVFLQTRRFRSHSSPRVRPRAEAETGRNTTKLLNQIRVHDRSDTHHIGVFFFSFFYDTKAKKSPVCLFYISITTQLCYPPPPPPQWHEKWTRVLIVFEKDVAHTRSRTHSETHSHAQIKHLLLYMQTENRTATEK